VTLKKTSTGQTETLGNVRLMFSGKISPSCVNMASHSASGTAKLAIAVFPGNSRFEIGEIPTYRIDATSVYSCGLKKGR
jgi:hypothetical protein